MRTLRRFLRRLSSWTQTQQNEERLRAEIEEHIALQTADNIRAGLSPLEARRQAVLKFGAVEATKEEYRDQRGLPPMEILLLDMRHALRRLRLVPAFTMTTIATLALGIGATTSIFTLVHAILLQSLPVANPGQLFRLGTGVRCNYCNAYSQENEISVVSYDGYRYLRTNTKGVAQLAAFEAGGHLFGVRRPGSPEIAQTYPGEFVSGNYFAMFGLNEYAGRMLTARDENFNAPPVAVMSHRLWQQKYASDPSIIGTVLNLNHKPVTVVGITPPGFFGDTMRNIPPDFFLPLTTEPYLESDNDLNHPDTAWLALIGRIDAGTQRSAIEAEMRVELKQWLHSHWGDMDANARANFPRQTLYLKPGGAGITRMRDQYEHWLQILMLVSGVVLLIVCANVANLMLVRGLERRRQVSVSMALGARNSRVVGQALAESMLLSLFGGAAGLVLAFAGTRLILGFAFPSQAGLASVPISASPSTPVLLFALGVSLITGVAFGIAPAWMATQVDPIEALRGAGRGIARSGSASRKALVVLQAALCLVLLSASGLLTSALLRLETQDLGFEQDRRTIATIEPRLAGYGREQLTPLYQRIRDSFLRIPGVSAVALTMYSPLNGNNWSSNVWVDGQPPPGPNADTSAWVDRVTTGYFEAVGNRIVRGRGIEQDIESTRHVAVINEAFARKFFGNEDPIGKHFGQVENRSPRLYEIVGVAKDARYMTHELAQPIAPMYFLPEAQHDVPETNPGLHFLHDIVIVTKPGVTLSPAQVSRAMASVDPNLPVILIRPLSEQVAGVFRQQRLIARLTSLFGILSLLLACIGVYGVTAYNAGCRTMEIGVRMALGATRSDAVALILRGVFWLILCGLIVGIPLAFAAGRFLGNQLYGVNPFSPAVTSAAVGALGLSALVASLIPALKASRISPVVALRDQ